MQKLLAIVGLVLSSNLVFAETESAVALSKYHSFQEFDNQFYLGMGATYGNLQSAANQSSNYGTTFMAFGVERLFDMGLWLRVDGSMMTGYSNYNSTNPNSLTGPAGLDPSIGDLNVKIGYAFLPIADKLQLTPYALFGRNTNITANSLNNNQSTNAGINNLSANVTQDYFLTMGAGARLEYRINHIFDLYFDQAASYNSDQSMPNVNYNSASNYLLLSTIGAKFNLWRELQLGVEGFYSYTQLETSASPKQQYQLYPVNQLGAMASIGMTY